MVTIDLLGLLGVRLWLEVRVFEVCKLVSLLATGLGGNVVLFVPGKKGLFVVLRLWYSIIATLKLIVSK